MSPWGVPRLTISIAPGIWLITTASHGGFYLEPAANQQVPLDWKQVSFKRQAINGFYEEQCDACMILLTFPHSFDLRAVASADQVFESWVVPKLGLLTGSAGYLHTTVDLPLSQPLPPTQLVKKTS